MGAWASLPRELGNPLEKPRNDPEKSRIHLENSRNSLDKCKTHLEKARNNLEKCTRRTDFERSEKQLCGSLEALGEVKKRPGDVWNGPREV